MTAHKLHTNDKERQYNERALIQILEESVTLA